MPRTPTATVHRWADLPKDSPMERLERRRIIGDRAMISEVLLQPGCVVPSHAHENEQFACVMRGRVRFGIGTEGDAGHETIDVGAGEVLYLPGGVPHSAEALDESLVLDIFSPPSEKTGIDRT